MKSTTCPRAKPGSRKKRSKRLPSAPPSSRPSATVQPREPSLRAERSTKIVTPTARRVSSHVMPVPKDSAAPGLNTRVSWIQSPRSSCQEPSVRLARAHVFESWSAAKTRTAMRAKAPTRRLVRRGCAGAGSSSGAAGSVIGGVLLARGLATLLTLLALDAQRRPGEGHDARLADRATARLARAEGSRVEPFERVGRLVEHVAGVVHERELLLALERGRAVVGLVVSRSVTGVAQEVGELGVGGSELRAQARDLLGELGAHRADLFRGPGLLAFAHGEAARRLGKIAQLRRRFAGLLVDCHVAPLHMGQARVDALLRGHNMARRSDRKSTRLNSSHV